MFSSDTVHDVNENFPLRSHACPPSYELSAYTVTHRGTQPLSYSTFSYEEVKQQSRKVWSRAEARQGYLDIVVPEGIESAGGTAPIDLLP